MKTVFDRVIAVDSRRCPHSYCNPFRCDDCNKENFARINPEWMKELKGREMKTQADNYQNAERTFDLVQSALDECWALADREQRDCLIVSHELLRRSRDELQRAGYASKKKGRE